MKEYLNILQDPAVKTVFSASEAFRLHFGNGSWKRDNDTEQLREPLLHRMHEHLSVINPARPLTIWVEHNQLSWKLNHDVILPDNRMCRGFLAKSGTNFPGIHIFRLDDGDNTYLYRNRTSTENFFLYLSNIFLQAAVINEDSEAISTSGGIIYDTAIIMTDYEYKPLSLCIFTESSRYSSNPSFKSNIPFFFDNLPWTVEFQVYEAS